MVVTPDKGAPHVDRLGQHRSQSRCPPLRLRRRAPDVCPVGAIYSEEQVPDGPTRTRYNSADPNKGNDHTFFIQLSRDVFAD